jgi:hypothetical protein
MPDLTCCMCVLVVALLSVFNYIVAQVMLDVLEAKTKCRTSGAVQAPEFTAADILAELRSSGVGSSSKGSGNRADDDGSDGEDHDGLYLRTNKRNTKLTHLAPS